MVKVLVERLIMVRKLGLLPLESLRKILNYWSKFRSYLVLVLLLDLMEKLENNRIGLV